METEEKLYALMAIAEEQHAAIKEALAALATERDKLDATRTVMSKQLREVASAAEGASGAVQNAAQEALNTVLEQTVNATGEEVRRAFTQLIKPTLLTLAKVIDRSDEVERKLRRTLLWLSWRGLAVIITARAGLLLAVWLGGRATTAWHQHEIEQLLEERDALTAEIAELRDGAEAWKTKAGRAKLTNCGEQRRLCVRVDPRTVYGADRDYFILRGY